MVEVLDAMRSVHTEVDRWKLAESLHKLVPEGSNGFDQVIDEATHAGVVGNLSVHTLRLYRDTAKRWPSASRVPNISFSAHREAMVMIGADGNTKRAEKMLNDIAKTEGGPDKVTVASVRRAAAVQQGKQPSKRGSKTTSRTATGPAKFDVLSDIENGATQLLNAINGIGPDSDRLDRAQAGLSKALQRVEALRMKLARKAPTAAKPAAKPVAKRAATNGKPAAGSKKGDMRDL